MQASAVGTAALVGLFMARNKSLFRRVLYPLVSGTVVMEAIYLSDKKNREEVTSVIRKSFSENFAEYSPKKSTPTRPAGSEANSRDAESSGEKR